MCGIVAVVRRKARRTSPSPDDVLRVLEIGAQVADAPLLEVVELVELVQRLE